MRHAYRAGARVVKLGSCSWSIRNRLVGLAELVVWVVGQLLVSLVGRKADQAVVLMAEVATLGSASEDRVIVRECGLRMLEVAQELEVAAAAGSLVCLGARHGVQVTVRLVRKRAIADSQHTASVADSSRTESVTDHILTV